MNKYEEWEQRKKTDASNGWTGFSDAKLFAFARHLTATHGESETKPAGSDHA